MNLDRAKAAAERSQHVRQQTHRPPQRRSGQATDSVRATAPLAARMQVLRAQGDDAAAVRLEGFATVYEQPYEMWDMWGPYTEIVSAGAGETSLNANPYVKYLFNHRGMPMASTRTSTLSLDETDEGLHTLAQPLMTLPTSAEVVLAVEAGLIDEMSFAFMITRGAWSPDYTEYRIHEYDIDRGDVSPVTYGANPATDVSVQRDADEGAQRALSLEQKRQARDLLAAPLLRTQ